MSTRCYDWHPLAEVDPIGGDVDAVSTEASYYSNLAQEISDQVTRLRKIAGETDLTGKAADKLRSAAGDTADKLTKTIGRVQAVGSALTAWVPHLETAQRDTYAALCDAQDAQRTIDQNPPPPLGAPAPTTPAAIQDETNRANRHSTASTNLEAARTKFKKAVDERDHQAGVLAGKIQGALHDGLKDGFWDHISHWVSQHAKLIKQLTEILSWIATAVAIACIFIPGLNILAIGLTLALLASHSLLAATGNGSWMDVAVDAFALATLGAGRLLGKGAELARGATLARGGELAAAKATQESVVARNALRLALKTAPKGMAKFGLKNLVKQGYARSLLFDAVSGWKTEGAAWAAKQLLLKRALPEVSNLEKARALGTDIAENMKDYKALMKLYGTDPKFAELANDWQKLNQVSRVVVGTAAGVDAANHGVSKSEFPWVAKHFLPGVPAWEKFKESTTWPVGQP